METKKEIHARDYAVSAIVGTLLNLFVGVVDWKKFSGLDVKTVKNRPSPLEERGVYVYPVGWLEEEYIYIRFQKVHTEWVAVEGVVCWGQMYQGENNTRFSINGFQGAYWISSPTGSASELLQKALDLNGSVLGRRSLETTAD